MFYEGAPRLLRSGAHLDGACSTIYGFDLDAPLALADDPGADELDALLCAIQAAWGWARRDRGFGAPVDFDRLEGWICDPGLSPSLPAGRR